MRPNHAHVGRAIRLEAKRSRWGLAAALSTGWLLLAAASEPGQPPPRATGREPIVGLPCEGCDAVFQGMPDSVASIARIAPADEPGAPLRIEGTARDANGRPIAGVIVYAYHTDARGFYPTNAGFRGQAAGRHGRLRGWARTDESGRYRFDTIRPAGYPDSDIPQHVHLHVLEPGRCTYYIDDLLFDDDPRMTPRLRREHAAGRGGPGVSAVTRDADGTWRATRDVLLGSRVPGYPEASPPDRP